MKSLIIYYSYSGNTDKVAHLVAKILKTKGEVEIKRLMPEEEITTFIGQCRAAFTHKRAVLGKNIISDVSPYDLIVIGSPIWAFAPTPTINTYLDKISGLNGKKVITLLTSGSGVGVKKCFGNIRKVLEAKGASRIEDLNIPDRKTGDEGFITSSLWRLV